MNEMSTCMNFHSLDNIMVCQQTFAKSGLIVTALLPSANASLKKYIQVPFLQLFEQHSFKK